MNLNAPKRAESYIPTASMADIAFLLIVFFMVTTTITVDRTPVELPTSLERVEVPKAIESIRRLVLPRSEAAAVEIRLALDDDLPLLRADVRGLKQILVNLLTNAIKFSHPNGRVTLEASCPDDSGFVFRVIDEGVGMAPEDIPKALAKFGQVDSGLNRKYEGTGLGLPLTKALVEQHGGSLDVQSRLGEGTRVTVRYPAERTVSRRDSAAAGRPIGRVAN